MNTDVAKQILQGDDTHPDILQALGLEILSEFTSQLDEHKYLLAVIERLRKSLDIEEQIVQAFYEYREDCCFDHCEAWMLENGHRVMVKIDDDDDEQSEWKVEVE